VDLPPAPGAMKTVKMKNKGAAALLGGSQTMNVFSGAHSGRGSTQAWKGMVMIAKVMAVVGGAAGTLQLVITHFGTGYAIMVVALLAGLVYLGLRLMEHHKISQEAWENANAEKQAREIEDEIIRKQPKAKKPKPAPGPAPEAPADKKAKKQKPDTIIVADQFEVDAAQDVEDFMMHSSLQKTIKAQAAQKREAAQRREDRQKALEAAKAAEAAAKEAAAAAPEPQPEETKETGADKGSKPKSKAKKEKGKGKGAPQKQQLRGS